MRNQLQRVLDAHNLTCGAVISEEGQILALAGDFSVFASNGLVSALIGPYGSAKASFDSARSSERIKPVIFTQGGEFAFLDFVSGIAVVLFGRESFSSIDRYQLSKLVSQTIAAEFSGFTRPN